MKKKSLTNLKKLLPYLLEEKRLLIPGLLTVILTSAARLLDPLIVAHIIDYSVPNKDLQDMFLYGGVFVAIILGTGFLSYYQSITLAKLGLNIITKIKSKVFNHLLELPVSYFDKNPVGELIARVESDCESFKQLFSQFSIMMLNNVLFFIGMMIVLFFKNWEITSLIAIPIPFIFIGVLVVVRYLAKYYRKIRELFAGISSILTEYIQGIRIVQLFNREEKVKSILDRESIKKKKIEVKTGFVENAMWGVVNFTIDTLFILLVIYLIAPKVLSGAVTIGTIVIFIQYGNRLFWPLLSISENINVIQRAAVSVNRIYEILAEIPEAKNEEGQVVFNEQIEFRNVNFEYKKGEKVLRNVSFAVNKGEKIALVGASGSGKTTTVSLLCGFYKIMSGGIYIDGKNLNSLNLTAWRKKIGLVLQDIFLFPGNILENVRIYNEEIPEEKVRQSLDTIQASSFTEEKGLLSELAERGANLSVGQKQLISFARAVVFDPDIIVLDEATSSIDVQTEARIQQAMEKVLQGKTAFIVAHRLSTVVNADKILLFDKGEITAMGTHNELLESSKIYRKLVNLHFGAE